MKKMLRVLIRPILVALVLVSVSAPSRTVAETVYQDTDAYIAENLGAESHEGSIELSQEAQAAAKSILKRKVNQQEFAYWSNGSRRVWILNEIGKYEPITAGFVIEDNKIVDAKVLVYRESHGDEVRYPYFVEQFIGLSLNDKNRLSKRVNGISGATLSVNSMRRMAEFALYLDGLVEKASPEQLGDETKSEDG